MKKEKIMQALGKAGHFIKTHKLLVLQLGIMGAVVMTGDSTFASKSVTSTNGKGDLSVIYAPLETLSNVISGPVATFAGTAGVALLGLATAGGMENQVAKRGMQIAGGVGCGMGAAKMIDAFGTSMLLL